METRKGTVIVADGAATERRSTVRVLERAGYFVRGFATGEETLTAAAEEPPAAVLFELELPDMSGYELCRALRQAHGEALPLLLMSGDRIESMDRVAGLLIGADDYIVKPFNVDELVARVRRFVDRRSRTRYGAPPAGVDVTPRELEVLRLLGEGNDQNEIAQELSISPKTVATHIQRLLTKFGARSRAQLVALAYRAGVFQES